MADPRNAVVFDGIGYQAETYIIDNETIVYDADEPGGSEAVGLAVSVVLGSTVGLAADGEPVLGKLILVESDGKAVVQTGGYCELPGGEAATLTLGAAIVGAEDAESAPGYIRTADSTTAAELALCAHKIIDADDATAVIVKLT